MKPHSFRRRVFGWMITMIIAYGVFTVALGLMQKHLMYFPEALPFEPKQWALGEMELFPVKTEDGLSLRSWYHASKARDKMTVAFFQGNAGHLGYRNYKIRSWLDAGYGVLLVGYRGFGNPGTPSEEGLYEDARSALETLINHGVPEGGIVLYGESMGTGVATQMASEFQAAGLVLESPYTSVPDVGADRYPLVPVRWILQDKFDSLSKIVKVHMPLLLLHGEADQVVPVKFGRQLFQAANEPKQAEFIPNTGHNDVYDLRVQQIVLEFISKLPTAALLNAEKPKDNH